MKLLACIALLLCAVTAADALRYITIGQRTTVAPTSWTRPWFCGDLECPVFKNLTRDEDYEIRQYKPGWDHSTHVIWLQCTSSVLCTYLCTLHNTFLMMLIVIIYAIMLPAILDTVRRF